MEGTIAEIRMFGGSFEPKNWMFCRGQILNISDYESLYTLIGTTYGGDGNSTFALPDLSSRVAIGVGNSSAGSYALGQVGGTNQVTLTTSQAPQHTHTVDIKPGTGDISASVTLNGAANGAGINPKPAGNLLGSDGFSSYYSSNAAQKPTVAISALAVQFDGATVTTDPVPTGVVGANQPHPNMQPFMATNYIICLNGVFPSRPF